MLHRHVSTVTQNGQTVEAAATVGSPARLEMEGWEEGYSAGCNLQSHR